MKANNPLRFTLLVCASITIPFTLYFFLTDTNKHETTEYKKHFINYNLTKDQKTHGEDGEIIKTIPNYIFQTYKSNNPKTWSNNYKDWFNSWTDKNPNYNHFIYDDDEADRFIKLHFQPHVYNTYTNLPKVVLKTDFFRYAVIYYYGGVYSDADTSCVKPIDEWKFEYGSNVTFICGFEFAKGGIGKNGDSQLIQWTFAATPKHPILAELLTTIIKKIERRNGDWSNFSYEDIMELTGPTIWTNHIKKYISSSLGKDFDEESEWIAKTDHHFLFENGLLVLPIASFFPWYYRELDKVIFVDHNFQGQESDGWKNEFFNTEEGSVKEQKSNKR